MSPAGRPEKKTPRPRRRRPDRPPRPDESADPAEVELAIPDGVDLDPYSLPRRYQSIGNRSLAELEAEADPTSPQRTAAWIRESVRQHLLPSAIQRLYRIGMGIEHFAVPTMVGKIVRVPASASVQARALRDLVAIGVPQQLGLVDDQGNSQAGVIALPPLDLMQAQAARHGAQAALDALEQALGQEALEVVDLEDIEATTPSTTTPADEQRLAPRASVPTLDAAAIERARAVLRRRQAGEA